MKAVVFYNLNLYQKSKMPSEKAAIKQQNKLDLLGEIMETAIEEKADFVVGIGSFFSTLPSFYALSGVYSRLNSPVPLFIEELPKTPIPHPKNVKNRADFSTFLKNSYSISGDIFGHIIKFFNGKNEEISQIEGGVDYEKTDRKITIPQTFPCFCGTEKGGFITVEFNELGEIVSSKFTENSIRIIQVTARDEDELKEKLARIKPTWGVNLTIFNRLLKPTAAALLSDYFHFRISVDDEQLASLVSSEKLDEKDIKSSFLKLDLPESVKKVGVSALETAIIKRH